MSTTTNPPANDDDPPDRTPPWALGIKSIGGLASVVAAVILIGFVAYMAIHTLGGGKPQSVTAVASAAFSAIATIVGAYFGVKIGTDQAGKAMDTAQKAQKHAAAQTSKALDTAREAHRLAAAATGRQTRPQGETDG